MYTLAIRGDTSLVLMGAFAYILMLVICMDPKLPTFLLIPNLITVSISFPFYAYYCIFRYFCSHYQHRSQACHSAGGGALLDSLDSAKVEEEMAKIHYKYRLPPPPPQKTSHMVYTTEDVLKVRSKLSSFGERGGKIFDIKIGRVKRPLTFDEMMVTLDALDEANMLETMAKHHEKYPYTCSFPQQRSSQT